MDKNESAYAHQRHAAVTVSVCVPHQDGDGVVGGRTSVEAGLLDRRRFRALRPWAPGFGRAPGWTRALICPSFANDLQSQARWLDPVYGLPAISLPERPQTWI